MAAHEFAWDVDFCERCGLSLREFVEHRPPCPDGDIRSIVPEIARNKLRRLFDDVLDRMPQ